MPGPLDKYQDAAGHVFSMTQEDAERMGYTPVKQAQAKAVTGPPENKAQGAGASK